MSQKMQQRSQKGPQVKTKSKGPFLSEKFKKKASQMSRSDVALAIATFILPVLMLIPILASGYCGDDAINSYNRDAFVLTKSSLMEEFIVNQLNWLKAEGRFFPLSSVSMLVFYCLNSNLLAYKISLIAINLFTIFVFAIFVRQFTGSKQIMYLSILLAPLCFQCRVFHEPILSFAWLLQVTAIYTFMSLTYFKKYLKTEKKSYLIISTIIYLASLFTYEIVYPFFLMHIMLAYFHIIPNKKCLNGTQKKEIPASIRTNLIEALKISTPLVASSVFCVILSIILRLYFGVAMTGGAASSAYSMNLDVGAYIGTLAKQVSAALPLSYMLAYQAKVYFLSNTPVQSPVFSNYFRYLVDLFSPTMFFIGIGYFTALYVCLKQIADSKSEFAENLNIKQLIGLAAIIIILPAVMIALSPKHQKEVNWGLGYLPVYISYYGTVLLMVGVIIWGVKRNHRIKRKSNALIIGISCIGAMLAIVNFTNNTRVVEALNHQWLYPRTVLESSINNGLFKKVRNDSDLLVEPVHLWDLPGYYFGRSGLRLGWVGSAKDYHIAINEGTAKQKTGAANNPATYFTRYEAKSKTDGYVILGEVKEFTGLNDNKRPMSNEILIYFTKSAESASRKNLNIKLFQNGGDNVRIKEALQQGELKKLAVGDNWQIIKIVCKENQVDLRSIGIDL